MIELTRRYRFPAAHVLASPRLSDAENRRVYGKCAHPAGHGHDYGVEVTVRGEIDPQTGSLMPHAALDGLVEARVVARFDGPLPAPIAKGTKVGTAVVTLPDGKTIESPLEAGADVPRLGVVGRVTAMIQHYLLGWLSS